MPEGIGATLKEKAGPFPIWTWAVIGTAGLAGILYYRQKQKAAASAADTSAGDQSNLGTVPISNLTTSAQPMPIQMGDTFVDVNQTQNPPPKNPVQTPTPAAGSLKLGDTTLTRISSPSMSKTLIERGYDIYTVGKTQYYNPAEKLSGRPGVGYTRVSSPAQSKQLAGKGYKIITVGNTQFYAPTAKSKAA